MTTTTDTTYDLAYTTALNAYGPVRYVLIPHGVELPRVIARYETLSEDGRVAAPLYLRAQQIERVLRGTHKILAATVAARAREAGREIPRLAALEE